MADQMIAFRLPGDLRERLKRAAYWMRRTQAGIIVEALSDTLDALDRAHPHNRKPIPK